MKLLNGVALHISHHKSQNKPLFTLHAAHMWSNVKSIL